MIELAGRRIVLIGGAGFIGHHLGLALAQRGAEVHIVDGLQVNSLLSFSATARNSPNRELYLRIVSERLALLQKAGVPLHVQDARDYHALSRILAGIAPHVIIQLAAVAHAGQSNKDPFSTFDHSLRTLENALDNARGGCEHFIYFSSSMVYGNFATDTVTEASPCEPLGIYGALKYAGEKMVIAYNQVFALPYTIVRPSALYGERCVSRRVGQVFIENAAQGLDVSINGDGSERLDFTYIGDLVNGITRIIECPESRGQTFNITYGASRSIADMVGILKAHFPNVNINYLPKDNLMPSRGTLCVDKARRLLGYSPEFPLERGFVDYIQWYRQLFDLPVDAEVADRSEQA